MLSLLRYFHRLVTCVFFSGVRLLASHKPTNKVSRRTDWELGTLVSLDCTHSCRSSRHTQNSLGEQLLSTQNYVLILFDLLADWRVCGGAARYISCRYPSTRSGISYQVAWRTVTIRRNLDVFSSPGVAPAPRPSPAARALLSSGPAEVGHFPKQLECNLSDAMVVYLLAIGVGRIIHQLEMWSAPRPLPLRIVAQAVVFPDSCNRMRGCTWDHSTPKHVWHYE
ncbi:hypothetical protein BV25DRAFT_1415671 [Artomyces pyxidatus]|uniref:Uncharacterized protein n=1 Tax=Artomyces pyxidatus TaxID=48021 RepID=A0ACB8TE35_9AGAM|nr:hypothetical protein BV25DRAFT_1415671 [Artomyces pyxidatus]